MKNETDIELFFLLLQYKFLIMRKVHLISISDPLAIELASAILKKGYEVSVSSDTLTDKEIKDLNDRGVICRGNGWFPDNITKETYSVVFGSQVTAENPEYLRAKELGLLLQSIPKFIYQRTISKTRVVVAGSRGRKTIIALMVAALRKQKMDFDYVTTSDIKNLNNHLQLSYEGRIALIEGDEHITSLIERQSQLEFYHPHIAIMTNLNWNISEDHSTPEAYMDTYRCFSTSIEREGKLIYYGGDPTIDELVQDIRSDITAIPFQEHPIIEKDGQTFLNTRYGEYPIRILNSHFLININAARLACRQLGINDKIFYQAVSDYTLSL